MPSRADDIYWAFNNYLLNECMNTFILNSVSMCVCMCMCAFIQVQFYSTFSQVLSGLGVHLLSELYSTLALLIKRTFLDYQKREIAQVSIFAAAVHLVTGSLFLFKLNAIKTFILSIFFPASCWNVKIVSVLNDWGGQIVSHIFL